MRVLRVIFCFLLSMAASVAATNEPPKFEEIFKLVRTNLSGVTETELNRTAVRGLLNELRPLVSLQVSSTPTNSTSSTNNFKAAIYERAFVYFRASRVGENLSRKLSERFQELSKTNKFKGIVLDLRFAEGNDYLAAAKTADLFLNSEQPLLNWEADSARATAKTNAITLPVVILVNKFTSGSAEALAAVLRETKVGLLIGSTTAGQANIYKEFPLENGQRLRIATAQIKVGQNQTLKESLKPDIEVAATTEDEKIYLEDAYRKISKPIAPNQIGLENSSTNLTRSRLNEKELVRLQREGLTPDSDFLDRPILGAEAALRLINDPALARALDLLKGLAVVRQNRPL
ncbi:MAG: S41 family peptidase [Verrucomicrobiota bacterium]|nr:S41 family peptidase [Verrucomicrobiota bacterium]